MAKGKNVKNVRVIVEMSKYTGPGDPVYLLTGHNIIYMNRVVGENKDVVFLEIPFYLGVTINKGDLVSYAAQKYIVLAIKRS